MRFELTTPTLARLCSTPELRPLITMSVGNPDRLSRRFRPGPALYGATCFQMQQGIFSQMHYIATCPLGCAVRPCRA
jgi:hypothetical protein